MNEWWFWIQTNFNDREIAIGIWLLFAVILCLFRKEVRSGIWSILKTVVQIKLLILFGSLAFNTVALCWLFSQLGLWASDQLIPAILWYFFSGLVLTCRSLSVKEDERYFRSLLWDNLRIIEIFEFIVVAYSFSLLVELFLVPIMVFVGLIIAIADTKKEYASVKRLFEWIALAVLIGMLWKSMGSIWGQSGSFVTVQTGRNFLLPIILTIGSIPFFYFWFCFSHIENASIRIDRKTFQSDELKHYARKRFFFKFMVRPWLLQRAVRQFHNLPATTSSDVDQIIADILLYERRSKNPPEVDENLGWSPYSSRDFLKAEGLRTSDYHSGYKCTEWWASSNSVNLEEQVLPNTVIFYIEGLQDVVTTLKLKAHFLDNFDPTLSKERFNEISQTLMEQSMSGDLLGVKRKLKSDKDFTITVGNTKVVRRTERYPSEKGFELYFTLSRGKKSPVT